MGFDWLEEMNEKKSKIEKNVMEYDINRILYI